MLKIENLSVRYGNKVVIDNLSLEMGEEGTLALIGESGAGKSTLCNSVMRLSEGKISGKILFDGEDINSVDIVRLKELRWKKISYVFQNVRNVLNPVHKVIDQVSEPLIASGEVSRDEARERAAYMLKRFGLKEHRFEAYQHQLSGGEQQRVLIAMALICNPKLLLLDEPLSALDAKNRTQIGELIKGIGRHHARLLVTHDLDTAARLSEELAVLYTGQIVEKGPTKELLANPRHPYTRALIRSYPNMTTTKDLQGISGKMRHNIKGCPFHERCSQAIDICSKERPLLKGGERKLACHRGGVVTLLKTENISKSFEKLEAVKRISIDIKFGETVALVGQSGSGKTTLAKLICGYHKADSGSVELEGAEVKKYDKAFYRDVQMVYQNPGEAISHRFDVLEALEEPLVIQKIGTKEERRAKVLKMLSEVELPAAEEFLEEYPHHLSGGELQRLSIGRALMLNPKLLIADEPTASLDASVQAKVLKLLLKLQEERGLSLLYITHDIAAARKVADRVIVMKEGQIVEKGPASEITANPKDDYTKELLSAASSLE